MSGGETSIAGEQQLRLVGLLGERERFPVVRDRAGRIAVTLVDLPEHDQRHRQVIELPAGRSPSPMRRLNPIRR